MSADNQSLVIPPAAQHDQASFEVLRVWVADRGQHISIRSDAWEDASAWGILLADLARHIALAQQLQDKEVNPDRYLTRILEGFRAEIEGPTDKPTGKIIA